MVAYDLTHLTQAEDQAVIGPIQDDEALLLFALIRTMRLKRVLEIGGLDGYSERNFLKAVGPKGVVYTVDLNAVPVLAENHRVLAKNCATLTPADLDGEPLDLVFFDCHDYHGYTEMFQRLCNERMITDATVLALHDTGLHPRRWVAWSHEMPEGWMHQCAERRMVNELHLLGYDAISFHMTSEKSSPEMPVRHGVTVMQRFKGLHVPEGWS